MKFIVKNISDLKEIIKCIKNSNKNIILLNGKLGSGKTTLVKEFLKDAGINEEVTSPTFSKAFTSFIALYLSFASEIASLVALFFPILGNSSNTLIN